MNKRCFFLGGLLIVMVSLGCVSAEKPSLPPFPITIVRPADTYRRDITRYLAFYDNDLRAVMLGVDLLKRLKASSQILFLDGITFGGNHAIVSTYPPKVDGQLREYLQQSGTRIKIIQAYGVKILIPGKERGTELDELILYPGDIVSITRSELNDGGCMMP